MDNLIQALQSQGIITVNDIERMTTLELLLMIIEKMNGNSELYVQVLEILKHLDNVIEDEIGQLLLEMKNSGELKEIVQKQLTALGLLISDFPKALGETDDAPRLQRAIDHASSKKRRLVINEPLILNQTVHIKANTHLVGYNQDCVITTEVGESGNGLVLLQGVSVDHITIEGLVIKNKCFGETFPQPIGHLGGTGSCILLADCEDIVIKDCHLTLGGGYKGTEGVGNLWLSCCRHALITHNRVDYGNNLITVDRWYANNNEDGVDRTSIHNLDINITDNILSYCSGRAICIENKNNIGSILIANNTISGCVNGAIDGRDFSNCIITNNVIDGSKALKRNLKDHLGVSDDNYQWNTWEDMQYGLQLLDEAKDCVISDNTIRNIKLAGIAMYNSINANIENNRIVDCGSWGLMISNLGLTIENLVINGNNFIKCYEGGVYLSNSDDVSAKDVVITSNNIETHGDGINSGKCYYMNISNNILNSDTYHGGRGIIIDNGGFNHIENNILREFKYGLAITNSSDQMISATLVNTENPLYLMNTQKSKADLRVTNCSKVLDGSGNSNVMVELSHHENCSSIKEVQIGANVSFKSDIPDGNQVSGVYDNGDRVINNTPTVGKPLEMIYLDGWHIVTSIQ